MQRLLIADCSDIFTSALAAELNGQFQIRICNDGEALLELLPQYQPDILIVNLTLPYKDGLTVLQETAFHPPLILAIAMYVNAYVQRSVTELGIDYTLIAPSVKTVVSRLQDMLKKYAVPESAINLEQRAVYHLHLLNIPTHLDGYRQLCLALPIFAKDPQQRLTTELYPTVAKLCGCQDGRAVEHSIRKAIRAAWKQRDNAIWRKYFTLGPRGIIPCPTNKAFICRLAEVLNAPNCLL